MIARLAERYKRYRSQQKTISQLAHMEDRELWDIGLVRGDIELVVRRGRLDF